MIDLVLMLAMGLQPTGSKSFSRLREEWTRNLREKHINQSVAEYAADGEFLQPDGQRVKGTAALRQLFETITATMDSDLAFTSVRMETSGDLAYDSGTYRETLVIRASRKRLESTGSYLTVYRRGRGGVWLIVEQVWTGAPAERGGSR
jgi:ketosteroid isomerase-like protein